WSSPQPQCQDPARALADSKGMTVTVDARLRDQEMGRWQGRAWADVMRDEGSSVHTFFTDFGDSKAPGGESLGDAVERILQWWAETMPKVAGQAIAVVLPGSLLSGFAAAMLGMRLSRCVSLNLPHAGLGVLDAFQNGVRITSWNPGAAFPDR
ncbi:MAG: histidine phosphatase family protein, partial [Planctomycetes bacterium]|nr:histidine phosphatase family protein [Planctomycetota bacterium]